MCGPRLLIDQQSSLLPLRQNPLLLHLHPVCLDQLDDECYSAPLQILQTSFVGLVPYQDFKPRIGMFSAWAARVGSKYSQRKAILPPTACRNST